MVLSHSTYHSVQDMEKINDQMLLILCNFLRVNSEVIDHQIRLIHVDRLSYVMFYMNPEMIG